jgi:D-alanine-D-alanine ligase
MSLRVGLTYNLKRRIAGNEKLPEDYYAEFDEEETINAIAAALAKSGCIVAKIEADKKAYGKLQRLRPDIVFNIAEGLRGESREAQIPAILELLGIPYTGSGPSALTMSLNKALTHQILAANRIPSPLYQIFTSSDTRVGRWLRFPLVVKPLAEGSGKGVRSSSLVKDAESLRKQVSWVTTTYHQAAIVEEFLPGREFTVGLIGNDEPTVLPIVEIQLDKLPKGSSPLYSYEAKWIWDTPEKPLDMFTCPAQIPDRLEKGIRRIAAKTFKILDCRDICRIDVRLDDEGKPHVLEVNPLPGMIPDPAAHSCLPEAARAAGYTYDQLVCTIFWQALKRYGLQEKLEDPSLVKLS